MGKAKATFSRPLDEPRSRSRAYINRIDRIDMIYLLFFQKKSRRAGMMFTL
jgi:hypothetical protein